MERWQNRHLERRYRKSNRMSQPLILLVILAVVCKGACQLGTGQVPQFNFSVIDTTPIYNSMLPDSNATVVSANQMGDNSSSGARSTANAVSSKDAGTYTPPTYLPISKTPSGETGSVSVDTRAPAAYASSAPTMAPTHSSPTLTTAATKTNTVMITAAHATSIFATTATNLNTVFTSPAPKTLKVTPRTPESSSIVTVTTAAIYTNPKFISAQTTTITTLTPTGIVRNTALTSAVTVINSSPKANQESKSEPIKGEASTSRTPALTTTRARLKTPKFIHVGDVDYSYDDEDVQYEKKADEVRRGDIPSCEYDFCAHMQRSCAELSQGRCLCPGLTPNSEAPSPPRKFHVETITPSSAQVRWCAPLSVVSGYELEVQRERGGATTSHSLDPTSRMFWVWDLEERQAYTVCVTAKNGAGSSVPACVPIATPAEGSAVLTYALGAAVAALAALALVLAICLCRHCRKAPPENPRNASLISIPNPAYCHPHERADIFKM
ncbi:hypothetical protein AGOR_G00111630 [Albula goreensis]|uniref:Fibronectin type-III domain-containing protein n=1 Tax=Albula goreensis TaxID=1534307 RepID=A0A8T3DGC8_9TELE|nr:hypothetical protein AGOR_G00111630 [Albula goreensis]